MMGESGPFRPGRTRPLSPALTLLILVSFASPCPSSPPLPAPASPTSHLQAGLIRTPPPGASRILLRCRGGGASAAAASSPRRDVHPPTSTPPGDSGSGAHVDAGLEEEDAGGGAEAWQKAGLPMPLELLEKGFLEGVTEAEIGDWCRVRCLPPPPQNPPAVFYLLLNPRTLTLALLPHSA